MMKRSWNIVHKFEEKEKLSSLKKLTIKERFKIFQELYQVVSRIKGKNDIPILNSDKIKTLSNIHFTFQKLKI